MLKKILAAMLLTLTVGMASASKEQINPWPQCYPCDNR